MQLLRKDIRKERAKEPNRFFITNTSYVTHDIAWWKPLLSPAEYYVGYKGSSIWGTPAKKSQNLRSAAHKFKILRLRRHLHRLRLSSCYLYFPKLWPNKKCLFLRKIGSYVTIKRTLRSEKIFGSWNFSKNDEKCSL